MKQRALLAVDLQRDYIYGPHKTKDSEWLTSLATDDILHTSKDYYQIIMFGLTIHPYNHYSFKKECPFCVENSLGASIDESFYNAVIDYNKPINYYTRGTYCYQDDTSFMNNSMSRCKFLQCIRENKIEQLDIFGQSHSIKNLIMDLADFKKSDIVNVITKFCFSDDENDELIKTIFEYNINCDVKF